MKIFKTTDVARLHKNPINEDLYLYGSEGGSFVFHSGKLIYENFCNSLKLEEFYLINARLYRKEVLSSGESTSLTLIDGTQSIELPEFFIENLYPEDKHILKEGFFTAYVRNYPKKRKTSLIVFDCEKRTFVSQPIKAIYHKLFDRNIYGFDKSENIFFKRDLSLNLVWSYLSNLSSKVNNLPIKYSDVVVFFNGPIKEETFTENYKPKLTQSGGCLIGLSDVDGTLLWQDEMPEAIDDMRLHNDMLYIAIYNQLRVMNPLNGEIIKVVQTGTSLPDYRQFSAHVFVDDNYIYYTHAEDEVLIIYDVNTYELVQKVSLPEDHQPQWHQFTDENTGKHYFTVNNNSQYVARSPVLEVDPANLLSQVEFEVEPEKTVEFISVNGDASQQELVITMTSESLDDALRFGEIHTRDLTQHHSFNHYGMSFAGRKPTETFNGTVRFVLSGCNADKTLIAERLAIMEKRFALWVEGEGFYACTDNSVLAYLVTEYKA